MAHDKREYVERKRGWAAEKLTGFRKPAKNMESEPLIYIPKEFRQIPGYMPPDRGAQLSVLGAKGETRTLTPYGAGT